MAASPFMTPLNESRGALARTFLLRNPAAPLLENSIHTHLAALSQQAHQLAAADDEAGLAAVEAQVDEVAAGLWGITDTELQEIRRSLEELG